MGKKSKFKQLRKIASTMPAIQLNVVKGEVVEGRELEKEGIKEVEDKPIDSDAKYRKKTIVQQPLNHHRQMKKLYNKMGALGVRAYVNEVNRFVSSQKAKQENSDNK